MALTQPFISSIPAFNATSGTTIYVNILGGDTVNSITIKVDNLTNGKSTAITQTVTDNGGDEIRTFGITLNQTAWAYLFNDCNYQVRTYSTQSGGVTTNSISSSMAWFTCCATPTIDLYYRAIGGNTWTQLTASTVLNTDSIEVQARMSSNTAVFGSGELTVYKYYDTLLHTWSTSNITSFNDNIATVERLTSTGSSDYYTFYFVGETADGMAISKSIQGVKVTYTTMTVIDSFSVQNVCANGNIAIAITFNSANKSNVAKAVVRRKVFGTADTSYVNVSTVKPINSVLPTNVSFVDNFGASHVTYTYSIVAYNSSGTILQTETDNVYSDFNSVYVGDGDVIYKFAYSWNVSNAQRVQKSATYEPYGAKYPTVAYNAKTNYAKQTTQAKLLTANTLNNSEIDRYGQATLLEQFNDFLTNCKAKFFKDFNGNCRLITVVDAPTNSFIQEVGNSIADVQFSWVEIGDFTQSVLNNVGFAEGWTTAVNTWSVSYGLENCTSSNINTTIVRGGSYTTTLTANTGYSMTDATVTIYMGGTDITSTAYTPSTGVISIASVTGNLIIGASAVASTLTITNTLSTGVSTNNSATSILYGKPYSAKLSIATGYTAGSTTIFMGDENDITDEVFDTSTRTISISTVTDDLKIVATATVNTYRVTNTFTNCSSSRPATDTATYHTAYTVTYGSVSSGYTLRDANITVLVGITALAKGTGYTYTYNSSANTGTLRILSSKVTGPIFITFTPKEAYTVTLNGYDCTASGYSDAIVGQDYTAKFTISDTASYNDFDAPIVRIGGTIVFSGYTVTKNTAKTVMTVTIDSSAVTGAIIIWVSAIATTPQLSTPQNVSVSGSTATFDPVTTTTGGATVTATVTYDIRVDGTSIGTYTPSTWEDPVQSGDNLTITQVYGATQSGSALTLE